MIWTVPYLKKFEFYIKISFTNVFITVCTRNPHWTESPLDGIPTGRNPHWTESPLDGIPTGRNPQWTESPLDGIPTGRNPHWTESPLDGIPTGRNPQWTESPLDGIPTGRNPHWTESPLDGIPTARLTSRLLMYFYLALPRHYEEDRLHCVFLFVGSYQGLETEEMRGYSCFQGLSNPRMGWKLITCRYCKLDK